MPSIRSISTFALSLLGSAQSAFGLKSPISRVPKGLIGASEVCHNQQLSCHNTTAVGNLCCFNAPGGSLLQTQFWDTSPAAGPSDSWTIHGLWPDNCDGTYSANCDDARAYTNISAILRAADRTPLLNYMKTYWVSNQGSAESFWEHEWGKHGTCISTLDPDCYTDYQPTEEVPAFFERTVSLFKSLPTYKWLSEAGITPSTTKTYTLKEIETALSKNHGGQKVYLGCYNGALDEVWYYYNVRGSVQTGTFVPAAPVGSKSTCSATGIKYLPKGSSSGGGGGGGSGSSSTSTSTSSASTPTPTGPAFSGKGYLNVITSGSKQGCIISYGTWYTTGTCATFSVSSSGSGSGFTLASSKGNCAVKAGKFQCSSSIDSPSTFSAEGSTLVWDGRSTFHADAVPTGDDQGTVYMSEKAHGHQVSLTLKWQGL